MALQWGVPSTITFHPQTSVDVIATKALGGGSSTGMFFRVTFGGEGPEPTEETVLGWLAVLHNAFEADGWTADLRFTQTTSVTRQIEEV
jgi:hypothetical protein